MSLLNDLGQAASAVGNGLGAVVSSVDQQVQNSASQQSFQNNGFIVPPIPGANGNGLPSSQIPSLRTAVAARNIAHWFIPQLGVVPMYINPQDIKYNHRKLITKQRTKSGFMIQYWGEELTELTIFGHTGSSGVEGLNVLYEIYRAEQYLFDPVALVMAADSSVSGLNDLVDQSVGNIGGLTSSILNATSGLLGLDPVSQNILPQDIPSLSEIALGIELYYAGWVWHGYFTGFSVDESVNQLGLFPYTINFTATQRRGYRTNYLPWQRSAISGPSNSDTIPLSFGDLQTG